MGPLQKWKSHFASFWKFHQVSGRGLIMHCVTSHEDLSFYSGSDSKKNNKMIPYHHQTYSRIREHLMNFDVSCRTSQSKNGANILNVAKSQSTCEIISVPIISCTYKSIPKPQFFHSKTNVPMYKNDWDFDSDDDSDDEWLNRYSQERTNEFDEVLKSERNFMSQWNNYIISHTVVSDRSIPYQCMQFIETEGEKLIKTDSRRNLLLNLFNLWDNGIISSEHIINCTEVYDVICRDANMTM